MLQTLFPYSFLSLEATFYFYTFFLFFFFWLTRKDSKVKAVFNKLFDYTSQILD